MMAYETYLDQLGELIQKMKDTQGDRFDQASDILADCVAAGKLINVWGPGGHSSIFAEDVMYRKGELAAVNPIIDPGISLGHGGAKEINGLERVVGLGKIVIDYNRIKKDDVIVLGSAYGINPVLIEAAMVCRQRGVKVIGITSPAFSDRASYAGAKHESGTALYNLCDVFIDSFVPYGDAVIQIKGMPVKTSPVATIMQLIALKALMAQTMEKLIARGITPPVWTNSLQEGGIEDNASYMDAIWGKVKSM